MTIKTFTQAGRGVIYAGPMNNATDTLMAIARPNQSLSRHVLKTTEAVCTADRGGSKQLRIVLTGEPQSPSAACIARCGLSAVAQSS